MALLPRKAVPEGISWDPTLPSPRGDVPSPATQLSSFFLSLAQRSSHGPAAPHDPPPKAPHRWGGFTATSAFPPYTYGQQTPTRPRGRSPGTKTR